MQKFDRFTAPGAPFPYAHVDTDQIIPARYMTTISRRGLGEGLFAGMRYEADGRERAEFVLNQAAWRDAGILVAYDNFGCGSSREHAPWALLDFGIRCVVAPSFGDIFRINCVKNGLLPAQLPRPACEALVAAALAQPGRLLTVDLERQRLVADGAELAFSVDARDRRALMEGADDIARSLRHEAAIAAYEAGGR